MTRRPESAVDLGPQRADHPSLSETTMGILGRRKGLPTPRRVLCLAMRGGLFIALAGAGLMASGAGAKGPALAQVTLTGTDTSRLRDTLSAQGFGADVCRYDVNGNGTEDLLVVYRSGWWRDAVKAPPPGGAWSAESVTAAEKGVIIGAVTLNTLDTVVKLTAETPTGQAENVYLRMFNELYEVPVSSVADCRGSLDSYTYRMCLMKGFFTREKTQSFPTLPRCPRAGKKDPVGAP